MKKFLLFLISLFAGIGIFIWIGRTVGWQGIKNAFLMFVSWRILIIFIITFLILLVGNWRWKEILKGEEVEVKFWELFSSYLAGFGIMFLIPILLLAGEFFRGYILKEKKKINFTKSIASVILDRILEWTTNLIVIFFGSLFFLYKIGFPPMNLLIIFGGVFLIFLTGISFFYFKTLKKESIVKTFLKFFNHKLNNKPLEIEKEFFSFFKSKKSMWKSLSLSFFRATIMYLRSWLLIYFLGKEIDPLACLSILGFTYLAVMIPIPTALGSHEAIQIFAFSSLGLNPSLATTFTMIIRGAELTFALIGLVVSLQLGTTIIKNKLLK